jgi:hypothetical protein
VGRFLDLDVTLKALRPTVRRRFLLHDGATLVDLYAALSDALGYSGARGFEAWRVEPGADPLATAGDPAAARMLLSDLLGAGSRSIVVIYDPDAWWEHVVTLKRVRELPIEAARRLVSGRGAAPPEGCGGLAGYEALRAAGALPEPDLDDLRSGFDA